MIISHSLRFVYIGPPKTGSTSMHLWLRQPSLFDETQDIDTSKTGGQHDWIIPKDAARYYTFVTTRDHDAWLDSLWRQSRNDSIDYPGEPLMSFAEFFEWRKTCDNPFYARELNDYYPSMVDCVLRREELSRDISQLPFWVLVSGRLRILPYENYNKRNPLNKESIGEMVFGSTEDTVIRAATESFSVRSRSRDAIM